MSAPGRPNTRDLLSVSETADLAAMSEWAVRRRIRAGNLPAIRLGSRTLRVHRADAEALRDAEGLMTAADLAAQLRVSPDTVYRWARAGKLGHVQLGGLRRFRQDDLDRFLAENARGAERRTGRTPSESAPAVRSGRAPEHGNL